MKTPIINIISTHNLTLTYQKHVAKCLWGDGNSHLFNMAIQSLLSCLNQNIWTQVCVVALCVRTLQTIFTFLRLGESWLVLTGNTHAIILYSFFCRSDWWCCSNCGVYTVLGEFRMSCLMQGTCRSGYVKMLPWACIRGWLRIEWCLQPDWYLLIMECLVHVKNVGAYMIWAHIYRTYYFRMLPWLYCESIAYPCIVIASKGKHLPGVHSVHVSHGKVISAHSFCKFYLLKTALYFGKLCLTSNLVSIPCSSPFYCCYLHANITNISLFAL